MRLLPVSPPKSVASPLMSGIDLFFVGATSLLTYDLLSSTLVQNHGAHTQAPGAAPLRPALTPATPLATPDTQHMFPISVTHSSSRIPLPQDAPQEAYRVLSLLFLEYVILMVLNSFFPFVSALFFLIRMVYMDLPVTL